MALNLRSLVLFASAPYGLAVAAADKVNFYTYGTPDALATVLTAGYFNDARNKPVRAGDIVFAVTDMGTAPNLTIIKFTSVPSSGNVLVGTDDDQATVAEARAVVPTDDGLTTGLILASDSFLSVASANAAYWLTLPAIADVPLGKEIWGKIGGTACELRTPAASNTKINGGDADTNESVIAAGATFLAKKVAADEWLFVTYAPGAVAAPVPD